MKATLSIENAGEGLCPLPCFAGPQCIPTLKRSIGLQHDENVALKGDATES